MSIDIILFRGNTQENDTFAGKAGTITLDTQANTLRIHDGVTFGGHLFHTGADEPLHNLEIADISGVDTALSLKLATDLLGAINGVATLDEQGLIAADNLPSYVSDVVEVDTLTNFPVEGEAGKLYIAMDTSYIYRWSGSLYAMVSSLLSSTDAVAEGSVNLFYTPGRVRDSFFEGENVGYDPMTGMFSISFPVDSVAGKTGDVLLDSADVGLGLVSDLPMATTQQMLDMTTSEAYASPIGPRLVLGTLGITETENGWIAEGGILATTITTEDGYALAAEDGAVLDFEIA